MYHISTEGVNVKTTALSVYLVLVWWKQTHMFLLVICRVVFFCFFLDWNIFKWTGSDVIFNTLSWSGSEDVYCSEVNKVWFSLKKKQCCKSVLVSCVSGETSQRSNKQFHIYLLNNSNSYMQTMKYNKNWFSAYCIHTKIKQQNLIWQECNLPGD